MSTLREAIPDLLRRFSRTPHIANVVIERVALTVQTNDLHIIAALRPLASGEIDLGGCSPILVRAVRDDDAPRDVSQIVVISAWPLVTLLAGPGSVLVLDGERREILGFLSPAVPAERFVNELLPILLRRYRTETLQEDRELASGTI
jgi:hypothetical protein